MDRNENTNDLNLSAEGTELAIIGMAGRFPGARDLSEFWSNLKNGVESITFFSDEEVIETGVSPDVVKDPYYVKAGGILEDVEYFDAGFFGIYPQEAAILDPQHRLFLEVAWEGLENAGYNPDIYPGWIGVFAGTGMNTYLLFNLIQNLDVLENVHGYQLTLSNDKDFLPTRVSYKLNLRGPSINVQTACSTSLVAVHLASQSLLSYQCDIALAGGVAIRLPQKRGYHYQEGGIGSPDGHCRAFDANANGTVSGNGVGVVVLKRLEDAIKDGDNVLAIIRGSAINNDGSLKVGYTAPSVEGQSEVIATAQMLANVDPESLTYIEAHGTGTELGDPIEIAALNKVFQASTEKRGFCAIGSVKTNVGHLDAAAGVTSVIKTVLALQNREIPPSINYQAPNPRIDFKNSPFFVNTKLRAWDTNGTPRRAGVSSFGIGGTNAHVVIEEAPELPDTGLSRPWQLFPISARSPEALEIATHNLLTHLKKYTDLNLADVAYTLKVGRKSFENRRYVIANNLPALVDKLGRSDSDSVVTRLSDTSGIAQSPPVAFLFTGQGAQYVNMGRELYETEVLFKAVVDQCASLLEPHLGQDLREIIYPDLGDSPESNAVEQERLSELLMSTAITQPALFVLEYALANLLLEWGIEPKAMIGHSIGEYVAATLAGVFSLEDALRIVTERGRLMQSMPGGSMISVPLHEREVKKFLASRAIQFSHLALAAVNAPELCVISGPDSQIDEICEDLAKVDVGFRRLRTSHAFHSVMMEPVMEDFRNFVSQFELAEPEIPFISNVTGTWIDVDEAIDPDYWSRHLRSTVRFSDGIETLLGDPAWVYIEVGPGRTLTTLTSSIAANIILDERAYTKIQSNIIQTIRHPKDQESDSRFLTDALGQMWLAGIDLNWESYYAEEYRRRVALPTYPFQRQRYWIEPDFGVGQLAGQRSESTKQEIKKLSDLNEWFYSQSWKRTDNFASEVPHLEKSKWLLLIDGRTRDSFASALVNQLTSMDQELIVLEPGKQYEKLGDNKYVLNPSNLNDYQILMADLVSKDAIPDFIIHAWGLQQLVPASIAWQNSGDDFNQQQDRGFYSLLYLTQALSQSSASETIQIGILTVGVQDVLGTEQLNPNQAPLIGLCKVVTQEFSNLVCRSLDLSVDLLLSPDQAKLVDKLLIELIDPQDDRIVAYRGSHRWVQAFDQIRPHRIGETGNLSRQLRNSGVYLITGGLGRIGMRLAEYLSEKVKARIILLDRFAFPAGTTPVEWEQWLTSHDNQNPISNQIHRLNAMIDHGSELMIITADIGDAQAVQDAIQIAEVKFGDINGVIHAAGIVGEGAIKSISDLERTDVEAQFQPKVHGTQVLAQALANKQLDFVYLQSSLSAVLGGLGLGAYSAANLYLDVFAAALNRANMTPWISVDWDGWLFEEEQQVDRTLVELAMTPDEGVQVFNQIMSMPVDQHVVVSTADLEARFNRWVRLISDGHTGLESVGGMIEKEQAIGSTAKYPRPDLQTPYEPPQDDLQASIVQTWQKILGIDPIGIHDDFFELGGHSLLATQLVTRMRDTYKVQLPLRRLFESATVAGISELIREAQATRPSDTTGKSGDVKGILETISGIGVEEPIQSVPRKAKLELSYGQQRLWFLDRMDPESPLYNNFSAIKMSGKLNVDALQYSIRKMVERHEILRTTFQEDGGHPVQIIHPDMLVPLKMIDLPDIAYQDRDHQVMELAISEARTPFNLNEGPLLRVTLIHLSDQDHVLFLTMHHIISDGWSVRVLIEEVGAFYTAYQNLGAQRSESFVLPDLPIQYADYAYWQRDLFQGSAVEEQLGYWQNRLAEKDSGTGNVELPTDHPRPVYQSTKGATQWFELPLDLSNRLLKLSQREGVTLFMVLAAALQTLLHRYTSEVDISIGTPIANRTRIETESLIGFVLNTLVMRADLSGNPSFRELLKRVRNVAIEAYANQDIPFEMLVERLQPERDLSRSPFFQVIFDLQEAPLQTLELSGLSIAPLRVDSGTAKFDLALSMEMLAKDQAELLLNGYFNYNTDLFDKETILRLIEHWKLLLESISIDPNKKISALEIFSPAEKQKLLIDWSIRESLPSVTALVHEQFQNQAELSPSSVALTEVYGPRAYGAQMTYQELDQRANQLARYLREHGVRREKLVGVSVKRSIDMIVALLGILKAGGAFLPLDPSYPSGRLAHMIDDADIQILLTQERLYQDLSSELSSAKQIDSVCLDRDWRKIAREADSPLEVDVQLDDLAYVIYTSGSTGLPKGVMITHREIANHIQVMRRHFEITDEDQVLQFASLNFDAALEQIFTALLSGASLYLRGEDIWTAEQFHQIIQELRLSVVNVPPPYWHQWTQYLVNQKSNIGRSRTRKGPDLRLVIIGGDVMHPETVKMWQRTSLKNVRLLNAYGPTEATITATTHEVRIETLDEQNYHRVPIGHPLPNRITYILDQYGNPQPIGAPGELYLGGMGLSRGYLKNPDLSAKKFIPNPHYELLTDVDLPEGWGNRLYRTGDLVRYLPDGEIEFYGRIDDQVKVRGFRIELGEIETVLGLHPAVAESVAIIYDGKGISAQDGSSKVDQRLVAYVVLLPDKIATSNDLSEYLKRQLPAYMIPSKIMIIDKIPISPSGKLDRRALPGMDGLADSEAEYVAPGSSLEKELAALWAEVLGLEWDGERSPIGINDNFFNLGGHSLLATQIISRVRETYQVELPVRRLFETPTIAGLSEIISDSLIENVDSEEIEALLDEIESLSEEEVQKLIQGDLSDLELEND